MNNIILHTYKNGRECRNAIIELEENGYEFVPIKEFDDARNRFLEGGKLYSDLTPLFSWLASNESSLFAVNEALSGANDEAFFLINAKKAQEALDYCPFIFSEIESLEPSSDMDDNYSFQRRPLFKYKDRDLFDALVLLSETRNDIHIFSLSSMQQNARVFANRIASSDNSVILDLTSTAAHGGNMLLTIESLLNASHNLLFLVNEQQSDKVYEDFPSIFSSIESIDSIFPEINDNPALVRQSVENSICDLSETAFNKLISDFKAQLAGHDFFKEEFEAILKSFRRAHLLGDQHILSIFLFGESGVGKSETARILNSLLGGSSCKLAKINFESYSSKDSLNSLIGSPAGYIGCEGGELNDKVARSTSKVLLCDEFEKTSHDVQSFFLELLEDGVYTDRMGVEHDMDGFILVFTSNIKNESDLNNRIAPELRTRFDLICEFVQPSIEDKLHYVENTVAKKAKEYENRLDLKTPIDVSDIYFERSLLDALSLREIDKKIVRMITTKIQVSDL